MATFTGFTKSPYSKPRQSTHVMYAKFNLKFSRYCREGILFAVSRPDTDSDPYTPPPFLDFLLVLIEFCHRLLYVDRVGENSGVLPFLIKQLPPDLIGKVRKKEIKGWESLVLYREHTLPVVKLPPGRLSRKRPQKGSTPINDSKKTHNNIYIIVIILIHIKCNCNTIHPITVNCKLRVQIF